MKVTRKLNRRSFLGRVVGGAVAGGGALVLLNGKAEAQITDSDRGPNADAVGRGRGTGLTDSDSGPNADTAGNGRGSTSRRPCTDNDQGPNSDRAGDGRGNGVTDSDRGSNSDRAGCGRGRR